WDEGNQSSFGDFILVGMSDRPQLERLLFGLVFVFYAVSLLGNTTIIVVSWRDPRLHTPMYFFLSNLSFLDLCYTTSVGPQTLVNLGSPLKSISWLGCVAQLYVSLSLGFGRLRQLPPADRPDPAPAPVRAPPRGALHPHPGLLWPHQRRRAAHALVRLPRCGRHRVEHFMCELPALLKLACTDTTFNELELLASAVLFLLVPLGLILVSYGHISVAVRRMRSAQGRLKALNTCASHLAVVTLFYGTAISMYLQPPSSYSQDRGKAVSLFYTMVTPMLNPLIYTLRNKEVHGALRRMLGRTPAD
uniref:G-protein coupled receptors family 1 profile domain-containing protein n=1 Tax=Pelodiscus sinensis TaxID=13735 RepID=K7FDR5_PELSI